MPMDRCHFHGEGWSSLIRLFPAIGSLAVEQVGWARLDLEGQPFSFLSGRLRFQSCIKGGFFFNSVFNRATGLAAQRPSDGPDGLDIVGEKMTRVKEGDDSMLSAACTASLIGGHHPAALAGGLCPTIASLSIRRS